MMKLMYLSLKSKPYALFGEAAMKEGKVRIQNFLRVYDFQDQHGRLGYYFAPDPVFSFHDLGMTFDLSEVFAYCHSGSDDKMKAEYEKTMQSFRAQKAGLVTK